MAGELEVLRTLRELRTGAQTERQARRAHTLQLMQFQALQKQQEFQTMGVRLQMLQQVNDQLTLSHANEFITSTGIGAIYQSKIDDDNDTAAVISAISETYGLDQNQASRVTTALWHFYESQDASGVMSIANDLGSAVQKGYLNEPLSKSDKNLVKGLYKSTPLGVDEEKGLKTLTSMMKISQNKKDILAEIMEYGTTGDMGIERDIGIFDPMAASKTAEEEGKVKPKTTVPGIFDDAGEELAGVADLIKGMEDNISKKMLAIQDLETKSSFINAKTSTGMKLSETEEDFIVRVPELKGMYEDEISALSDQISDQRKISASLSAAESHRVLTELDQPDFAAGVDVEEISSILAKFDEDIAVKVAEGRVGSLFLEDIVGYGGGLKDASASEKWKLFSLAKKIQEGKTLSDLKNIGSSVEFGEQNIAEQIRYGQDSLIDIPLR